MPRWTPKEEKTLVDLFTREHLSVEALAEKFK